MGPVAGSSTTEPYRDAIDRLRRELAPTLAALDRAAADPWALDGPATDLPALRSALHAASERVQRIDLGPRQAGYEALEVALAAARDETADVADTLEECGALAATALVWEWRGALFAVRFALLELERPGQNSPPDVPLDQGPLPLVLLGAGVATVLGGALASLWPVWLLGLALVAVSTTLSHRLP